MVCSPASAPSPCLPCEPRGGPSLWSRGRWSGPRTKGGCMFRWQCPGTARAVAASTTARLPRGAGRPYQTRDQLVALAPVKSGSCAFEFIFQIQCASCCGCCGRVHAQGIHLTQDEVQRMRQRCSVAFCLCPGCGVEPRLSGQNTLPPRGLGGRKVLQWPYTKGGGGLPRPPGPPPPPSRPNLPRRAACSRSRPQPQPPPPASRPPKVFEPVFLHFEFSGKSGGAKGAENFILAS